MKILSVCSLCLLLSLSALADPTRPAAGWQADTTSKKPEQGVEAFKLQLIKDGPQGRTALINGQLLQKGQIFKHYRVEDIRAQQVILEFNGERHVLSLLNTAIKQYE